MDFARRPLLYNEMELMQENPSLDDLIDRIADRETALWREAGISPECQNLAAPERAAFLRLALAEHLLERRLPLEGADLKSRSPLENAVAQAERELADRALLERYRALFSLFMG